MLEQKCIQHMLLQTGFFGYNSSLKKYLEYFSALVGYPWSAAQSHTATHALLLWGVNESDKRHGLGKDSLIDKTNVFPNKAK